MTTVTNGSNCWTWPASGAMTSPKVPKTSRKPNAIAAVATNARHTAATVPRDRSSPSTTSVRYAGSIAKPHGLTAAMRPAANAKPTIPLSMPGVRTVRACQATGGSPAR